MKFLLLTLPLALFISGCATRQKTATMPDELPHWVQKTPADQQFYYGVGAATKSKGVLHRDVAKRHALRALSQNISVQVSATSLLQQYISDDDQRTFFVDHIRLNTANELEDYELAGEWEDRNQYWVLYRLCRSRFAELKRQRLQNAFNNANSHKAEAQRLLAENRTSDAIRAQILALESIRNFLNEDFNLNNQTTQESFSASLVSMLNETAESIRIEFDSETHKIELANRYENELITFRVVDRAGITQSGIPVAVFFSYSHGRIEKITSGEAGKIRLASGKVVSRSEPQQVAVQFNFAALVRNITFDPVIRALLANFDTPRFYLPVQIIPATIGLTVDNTIVEQRETLSQKLTILASQELTREGFVVLELNNGADFRVEMKIETAEPINRKSELYTIRLRLTLTAWNRANEQLFYHMNDDITGIGNTGEAAANDAFKALEGKLRLVALPALIRELQ